MAAEFAGFPRPDGSAGARNTVLVLSILGLTGASARRIARQVPGTTLMSLAVGRGQFGDDRALMRRMLVGLGRNANAAAVLLVGADRLRLDAIAEGIAGTGKPVETVALDDCHEDNLVMSERGVRMAAKLVRDASRIRRQALPASMLRLGIECGHTDATSGIAANPLVGRVADRLVDAGGAVVFGETMEWLGAEDVLAARAETPEVGRQIVAAVLQREAWAAASGEDLTGNNPGQENIRGGLSSIEEKSLGAIAKGGSRPVRGVVPHAAPLPGPGLWVMQGPSFSPPSITGFVAAGAQMTMFTTGAGNSYCDALAPTVKVSANPATARRLAATQIDFDGSGVLEGTRDPEEAADALFAQLLDHASGSATWGEVLDEGEYAFARLGADF